MQARFEAKKGRESPPVMYRGLILKVSALIPIDRGLIPEVSGLIPIDPQSIYTTIQHKRSAKGEKEEGKPKVALFITFKKLKEVVF